MLFSPLPLPFFRRHVKENQTALKPTLKTSPATEPLLTALKIVGLKILKLLYLEKWSGEIEEWGTFNPRQCYRWGRVVSVLII